MAATDGKVRRVDFSPDEFLAGVAGEMSLDDFAVYWMVCTLIYSRGKAIKDDAAWIAGKFEKTNPRSVRAAIERLVSSDKIARTDGELMVNRCRTELERSSNRIRTAHENGSKGGRPSKENNDLEKPEGLSDEKLTTNYQPTTTNQQREETYVSSSKSEFPIFWAKFPNKVGKPDAAKKFATARKKAPMDQIMDGLDRYIRTKPPDRAWLHPSTFLTQERWADEPAPNGGASVSGYYRSNAPQPSGVPVAGSGFVGALARAELARSMEPLGSGTGDAGSPELFDRVMRTGS